MTLQQPELSGEADDIVNDALLRDQGDLDSMDWLNALIGIHKRLKVGIPESDYQSLRALAENAARLNIFDSLGTVTSPES